ncbi:hypothetical protein PPSIR1_25076 [Plesiocystis pacifica SIR-1]|uniref:Lipoprotein n=1 Tax=Plesiocystis pacifica SIR-1 TaxID=391625 RepID=A6GDW3_9BACT|nr:hypothetical protein [Plesiocystis pacifica]EDM75912.1 hypothetical protein PPSIR1_25076 [Plesiocystis pacifica SIR-1]
MNRRLLAALLPSAFAFACTDDAAGGDDEAGAVEVLVPELVDGYPSLAGPCRGPVEAPTHLVVTSTDFNTGAVGLVTLPGEGSDAHEVAADLALASTDAVPVVDAGRVFVLNRFGFDYVDELAPADLGLVHEFAVAAQLSEDSANPHDLLLVGEHGWLSLFGAPELQRVRFPELAFATPSVDRALDLSAFADADGVPELGQLIGCGPELAFVSAERIDRSAWVPADDTLLIPVRLGDSPAVYDFDPAHPGADGIPLLGTGVGAWRLDPSASDGHTLVMLNSGLERIDLAAGSSEWVIPEAVFEAEGITRLHLSGFGYDSQGQIWLSIADADFSAFALYRADFAGPDDAVELIRSVEGLQSVTGALAVIGDRAYFADTTIGASGLRIFELAQNPVSELPSSPLPMGLPPLSLTTL